MNGPLVTNVSDTLDINNIFTSNTFYILMKNKSLKFIQSHTSLFHPCGILSDCDYEQEYELFNFISDNFRLKG